MASGTQRQITNQNSSQQYLLSLRPCCLLVDIMNILFMITIRHYCTSTKVPRIGKCRNCHSIVQASIGNALCMENRALGELSIELGLQQRYLGFNMLHTSVDANAFQLNTGEVRCFSTENDLTFPVVWRSTDQSQAPSHLLSQFPAASNVLSNICPDPPTTPSPGHRTKIRSHGDDPMGCPISPIIWGDPMG